jgi:uncharacterized protein (TIGR03437 family)
LATQAALGFPADVTADKTGNLYVADSMNHRVRKITPDGTITTIVGNGTPGFSGDGGPATSAQLYTPLGVAIDSSGNVYISDQTNNRIRCVSPSGVITTYAGGGQGGYLGDGGPASSATLFVPGRLTVDSAGNLYVADTLNYRIRKINSSGIITTVAGNGDSGFSGDGGPAVQAMLTSPTDVAVDPTGNLYIVDNLRIREVTPDGNIATVAGLGTVGSLNVEGPLATKQTLDVSWGVVVDGSGNLYVSSGVYIYRINASGVITLLVGGGLYGYDEGFDGDGGPAVAAHLMVENTFSTFIAGMTIGPDGSLYFADTGNDRIRRITNPGAAAQFVIENLDFPVPTFPYPTTGGDQPDFELQSGAGDSQRLQISNAGTGTMTWTATAGTTSGGSWLDLSATSGTAPSTITISADVSSLAAGLYRGTILLTAPGASNSPRYVSGSAIVSPPFYSQNASIGTLVVSEPPDTGWAATSDSPWVTFPAGAGGIGSGVLAYSVAANAGTTGGYRTATILIGGESLLIQQYGGLVSQTITFGPLSDVMLGAAPFVISATASSGLPVGLASTTTNVCTVSGSTVTAVGPGTCAITGTQAGNSSYAPATPVTLSFTVGTGPVGTPPVIESVVPLYSSINTIQPGSLISIYGSNLATSTASWNGDFPVSLAGTSVSINGKAGYLLYASPGQINLQAPDDTATGFVSVVVTTPNGSSASTVLLAPASPAFLRLDSTHVTGIIVRTDGSGAYGGGSYDIIGPTGTSLGYATAAAKAGDSVELYGVGFGPTSPSVLAGQPFSGAAATASQVYLTINNVSVTPSFAGLSEAGLYQINLTIPSGLVTGDVPLLATAAGVQTPTGVVISLQ